MISAYLMLNDGTYRNLELASAPRGMVDLRLRYAQARPPESDTWIIAGTGVPEAVDVVLDVRVNTGDAISDSVAVADLLEAARVAIRVGLYGHDGGRILERTVHGLKASASRALGAGWAVQLTLAGGPSVWSANRRITSSGDARVTSSGDRRVTVEAI